MVKRTKRTSAKCRRKNPTELDYYIAESIGRLRDNAKYHYDPANYEICIEYLNKIVKNSDFLNYLGGGNNGNVHGIGIRKLVSIQNQLINPGIYALKIYKIPLRKECFDFIKICSDNRLIPKIYLHNKCFTLMQYIEGISLSEIIAFSPPEYRDILHKTNVLISAVNKLNSKFSNIQLDTSNPDNFIVTHDLKHVFLIDPCA